MTYTAAGRAARILWTTALTGTAPPDASSEDLTAVSRTLVDRLLRRVSPGWAASLLAPLASRFGTPLVDPAAARPAALLSKLTLAAQAAALARLDAAGVPAVALKGFANAHLLHPDPSARIVGDLDVLVPRDALGAAIDVFAPLGYRFGGVGARRWGFVSDASFVPFHSPDGVVNIDLHVAPDAYPLTLGLPAADVFAGARAVAGPAGPFRAPKDEHVLLICASNAAKDRFGWQTISKMVDAARLLVARGASLDWDEIDRRAGAARLRRALDVTLALLVALGLPSTAIPAGRGAPPRGYAGAVFASVVGEWLAMFPDDVSGAAALWREAVLVHAPATVARLNARRLAGLLRPGDGVPAEARGRV
ncbi:MAG: nucleotidyltransferase family protein [Rhodospirillales bacterium]|nr:nucleotidyltransferase family protein [Rhodospirillales bacterium]